MDLLIWIGIIVCISQSAMFSGLNLAFFNISKLKLEVEMSKKNPQAFPIAKLREDSNFLLSTILWGNVSVNVLLTLLSGSVLAGTAAFIFSTFVITIVGEIIPQSYLSRNAMKAASVLAPVIKFYQVLLFPLAKPTALVLNTWLGKEAVQYIHEDDLVALVQLQMEKQDETQLSKIESQGMINIMHFDKEPLSGLGQPIEPHNVVKIQPLEDPGHLPASHSDAFQVLMDQIKRATQPWVVLVDETETPQLLLDVQAVFKNLHQGADVHLADHCQKPLLFHSEKNTFLDALEAIHREKILYPKEGSKIVLFWNDQQRRMITNNDALSLVTRDMFAHN